MNVTRTRRNDYIVTVRSGEIFHACPTCAKFACERSSSAFAYPTSPLSAQRDCELFYEGICEDERTA